MSAQGFGMQSVLTLSRSKQSLSPGPSISNCREDLTLPPFPGLSCKKRWTGCTAGQLESHASTHTLHYAAWGTLGHGCLARHLDLNLRRVAVLLCQGAAAGRSQVSRVVLPTHQRPAHSRWNAPPTVRPRHRRPGPPAWESPAWPSPGPEVSGAFRGTASPQR
ncbi:lymphocyte antigen 6E isoform X2 [Onychomys torridus]|uniref:lymphocyte antigen 6E isoform X2 n=1 Tax=Onychomys torridus TaxID=38674 RepID=UPI00167F2F45|nr:lymphocyte antigen 6E isoform X2 [Onychomys torridus]